MKPKLYPLLFLALLFIASSCKTAKKLYEKGHYDEAVQIAAKKLQKDPNDPKLLSIIRESYQFAEQDHQADIREHENSSSEMKWEWLYSDYSSLQKMYDAIRKVPAVFTMLSPVDYTGMLLSYGQKAADVRFNRGMALMNNGDKLSYRQAYREFQKAAGLDPGDAEISEKLNESYELAVTNVVIMPLQQYGGFVYSGYTPGGNNFDDKLLHDLQFSAGNDFVKFYSSWDARGRRIRVDQVLDLRLSTMNIGRTMDQRSRRRVSKEVVIKETVYKPDSVVKEYGTVYADITTTRRTIRSEALLEVNVTDGDGRWIWNDHFPAEHNWSTVFSTYTGDQRALSEQDKQQINNNQAYPPGQEEITRCLLEQINNDAAYRLRNFFANL